MEIKPLSETVRRNWVLYCEAEFARRMRNDFVENMSDVFALLAFTPLVFGFFFLILEAPGASYAVLTVAALVAGSWAYWSWDSLHEFALVSKGTQEIRLSDFRAKQLVKLYQMRQKLLEGLMAHPGADLGLVLVRGEGYPGPSYKEYGEGVRSLGTLLEESFQRDGDLGALQDTETMGNHSPSEVERVLKAAIENAGGTEASDEAVRTVEGTLTR